MRPVLQALSTVDILCATFDRIEKEDATLVQEGTLSLVSDVVKG